MSDQEDRLALIARAGKRLRNSQDHAAAEPAPPVGAFTPAKADPIQRAIHGQESVAVREPVLNDSPITGLKEPAANPATCPVRLAFPRLRREGMLTPDNMRSNLGFEYRAIKRKLLANVRTAQEQGRANNLIMVTSPRPAEGKTFTSANLAIALATERDVGVLLVDADVVRPKLTTMFDPPGGMGLTDLLKGRCNDITAIMHDCADLPNLKVVFSGAHEQQAPELLASRHMARICDDMSRRYSNGIVILDTPPVLASPETVNLAAYVHQIVMVVASGQTTRSQLQFALETVAVCPNISLLLNKAPEWNAIEGDTYYYYRAYNEGGTGGDGRSEPAMSA